MKHPDIYTSILQSAQNFLLLTKDTLKSEDKFIGSYHRNIQASVSIYCWFFSKNCPDLTIYSDSLSQERPLFARVPFPDGEKTALHQHNYLELAYIVSGEFHQEISGTDFCFREGELIITNQDTPHCEYLVETDCTILFLNIQNALFRTLFPDRGRKISAFISDLLIEKKESYSYLHFVPRVSGELRTPEILQEIVREIRQKEPGSVHILPGLLVRLFAYLAREYHFQLKKDAQEQLKLLLYHDIEEFIRQNYQSVTIEMLQKKYHYNADYFNRLIKKYSGMTYLQLRQNVRMEAAIQLLEDTSMTVEEIAHHTGYENLGHFYRLFEEKYHMTPGEYRRGGKGL